VEPPVPEELEAREERLGSAFDPELAPGAHGVLR